MSQTDTIIHLLPEMFLGQERLLIERNGLSASTFRFDSGVLGLRLKNDQGELVMLPFQGQQIWTAKFGGRTLTMTSMFSEPRPTRVYLETYGAFFIHCGVTGMGAPASPQDAHPLHGELPNAPYQKAWVVLGEDERGEYIGLSGEYHHTLAFAHNYLAHPLVKLYRGSTLIDVSLTIQNLKHTPMELMYLGHINFRPVDGGRIVYSAIPTPEHVRVRTSIPSHIHPGPGYVEFLQSLSKNPAQHHEFAPGQVYDPEVVFYIDYLADEQGFAHSMQLLPDGSADYVRHNPAQLDHAIRWMVRTEDQQALGFIEPATADAEGYTAEKAKGNLKIIPGGGQWSTQLKIGVLDKAQAAQVAQTIARTIEAAQKI